MISTAIVLLLVIAAYCQGRADGLPEDDFTAKMDALKARQQPRKPAKR